MKRRFSLINQHFNLISFALNCQLNHPFRILLQPGVNGIGENFIKCDLNITDFKLINPDFA